MRLLLKGALLLDTGGIWNAREVCRVDFFLGRLPLLIPGTECWLGYLQRMQRVAISAWIYKYEEAKYPASLSSPFLRPPRQGGCKHGREMRRSPVEAELHKHQNAHHAGQDDGL